MLDSSNVASLVFVQTQETSYLTEPAAVLLLDPLQLQHVGFSLLLHLLQLLHHLLLLLLGVLKLWGEQLGKMLYVPALNSMKQTGQFYNIYRCQVSTVKMSLST